jgi:hypothetical protein
MAISDYLQGIQRATTGEKQDVQTATTDLSNLQIGGGSLPTKLREALNEKLNNNRDLINQQADTMQNYFNSGAASREKYQDVWNPFEKAKLVQQERSMALRPYDVLSGVLENRMGDVNDIVQSGIQGWQGMTDAATTRLSSAQTMLATALQSYFHATGQQEKADQLGFEIAKQKEQSRQFEQNYGLDVQKFDENIRQFNVSEANKLKIAGMGSGRNGQLTDQDSAANTKTMQDEIQKIIDGDPKNGLSKAWAWISGREGSLSLYKVNAQNLWDVYTKNGGSSTAPVPKQQGWNLFGPRTTYGAPMDSKASVNAIMKYGSDEPLAWNDAKGTWTPGGK